MEFKIFDKTGYNGLNFSIINENKVNFDKHNARINDVYVTEDFNPKNRFGGVKLVYLGGCFRILTNNENHYITNEDLKKRFIKYK
jgi:hypothetical protein